MTTRRDLIRAEAGQRLEEVQRSQDHSDPNIRALGLGSLDRMGHLTDEMLRSALLDPDRSVCVRAIELSVDRASVNLSDLLSHDDDLVVETAAWALGERPNADPDIIRLLTTVAQEHDVSICREAAIAALGAIGDPDGLPAILGGLKDRAPVRRRAVLALAPFDSPEVTMALETALQDRDRQVRQAAEDLL